MKETTGGCRPVLIPSIEIKLSPQYHELFDIPSIDSFMGTLCGGGKERHKEPLALAQTQVVNISKMFPVSGWLPWL